MSATSSPRRTGPSALCRAASRGALALTVALTGAASADEPPAAAGPDELAFSRQNMDGGVSPAVDFYRYAAGGWLDRVERPARLPGYGFLDIINDRVRGQMKAALARAGARAATAAPGSPAQLVGTFYNALMDVEARNAAGMAPLRGHLDRIAAVRDLRGLSRLMAGSILTGGPALLAAFGPEPDLADSHRYAIYAGAGELGLSDSFEDVFDEAPDAPRRLGYRRYLEQVLAVAGYPPAEAARLAGLSIAIDITLHKARLGPVERADPRNIYTPLRFDEVQALIPELDLAAYFEVLGFPRPERIVVTEPRYFPVLSRLLRERPLQDLRDYATVLTILRFQNVLGEAFEPPLRDLSGVLTGVAVLPPPEERALALIAEKMGHPVSQVYVETFFTEETRTKAIEMIGLVKAAFEQRMPARAWLSAPTRAAAVEKLAALSWRVGYPGRWIDYGAVSIGPDPVADIAALAAFDVARLREKYGKPVVQDAFADPHTLPIVVNAAYNPTTNGFEVPAAILQAPTFDAGLDPAVNFCRLGAVLGHEMTHGFDSIGRQYDAQGNLRDWWSPADSAAFEAEGAKLVAQANAYEVLPGVFGNGALEVTENMADVGGLTLAHAALRSYLARHPAEDVPIDGLTPDQRCFIAWTQLWAWKGTEQVLRSATARDPHPANPYRATAPLRHLAAFHAAFGIKPGDPMWLPLEQRVGAW